MRHPVPSPDSTLEYFDAVASAYAHRLTVSPDFGERFDVFRTRMVEVRQRATAKDRAPTSLDIGCGPGTLAVEAASLGFHAIGVDGSPRMLEIARLAGSEREVALDLRQASVPLPEDLLVEFEGKIDLLVASSIIEYVAEDRAFAAQCARLLAPGGTGLVSFSNRRSVYRGAERALQLIRGLRRAAPDVPRYQHDEAAARDLFASVGLRARDVEYFAMPPRIYPLLWSARRSPWLATLFLMVVEAPSIPL